jgi:electron transfer flavoprotein beta subunit
VQSILNPFCEYALDEAIYIKKNLHDIEEKVEIIAITMGPPQAKAALLRCLELGADKAILLSDRKFAGADTWATALTVSEAIKMENNYDLILVGKQAIDGDTAQVGPEIAEMLGLPQICYGISTELDLKRRRIKVKREGEMGVEVVECRLPALISMSKGNLIRRMPSFAELVEARSKPIITITADDLGGDVNRFGLQGSLTQVAKVFPPSSKTSGKIIDGSDPEKAASALLDFLIEHEFVNKEEGS